MSAVVTKENWKHSSKLINIINMCLHQSHNSNIFGICLFKFYSENMAQLCICQKKWKKYKTEISADQRENIQTLQILKLEMKMKKITKQRKATGIRGTKNNKNSTEIWNKHNRRKWMAKFIWQRQIIWLISHKIERHKSFI